MSPDNLRARPQDVEAYTCAFGAMEELHMISGTGSPIIRASKALIGSEPFA